jgi:hypothetical protein
MNNYKELMKIGESVRDSGAWCVDYISDFKDSPVSPLFRTAKTLKLKMELDLYKLVELITEMEVNNKQ